ncbi:hypothetical protein FE74_14615, partial [Staphylococcus aureus]
MIRPEQLITPKIASEIRDAGNEQMYNRSAFTRNARRGGCERCYGKNLATGGKVEVCEGVRSIAAQSVGEPGTEITMRTV